MSDLSTSEAREQVAPIRHQKPTGFVATCQCGIAVAALDFDRTPQQEASRLLGKWLADGCTVEPRFGQEWRVTLAACRCSRS